MCASGVGDGAPNAAKTGGSGMKKSLAVTTASAGTAAAAGTNGRKPRLPLAAARKRLDKDTRRGLGRARSQSPAIQAQYAAVRAEGVPARRMAWALGIDTHLAAELERMPETQLAIIKRREQLKGLTMQEVGKTILPAWEMARRTVNADDPKGFDATLRGLHAAEKIMQGVTGEALRVEHSGIPQPQMTVNIAEEIKLLIAQVKGSNGA